MFSGNLDPYHMAIALYGIIDAFLFRMMEIRPIPKTG